MVALESAMVCKGTSSLVKRVAFVGSRLLPLMSIMLAMHHFKSVTFENYNINAGTNVIGSKLLHSHNEYNPSLSQRMSFITFDILCVGKEWLVHYDVVFVAALVGPHKEENMKVVKHIGKHIKSGTLVIIRSTHEGRAFLYPIVEEEDIVMHSTLHLLDVLHSTKRSSTPFCLPRSPEDWHTLREGYHVAA